MFDEDEPRPSGDPLRAVQTQDLDPLSLEQLETRIKDLEAEIARTRADIDRKTKHRSAAEALFKK
ncbi:MAG: DUF1192 domain-containing protein [Pseudomonadota bacterium]